MESPPRAGRAVDLRAVRVRPTHGASEHRLWDRLVATHHYLPFGGLFGKGLRQVATLGPTWVALVGWQAAALQLAARDRWIGWSPAQKRRRLHLVVQNSRFVVRPGWHVKNLASRVLGLSLRRLAGDMRAAHGFPVLLAETFIDPERFAGTCYRAANWRSLGRTRGYARQPAAAPTWRRHGRPKEILVYELQPHARDQLSQAADNPALQAPASAEPDGEQLRSLFEFFGSVPDYRHARGQRYELRTVLTLAVAGRLAGNRGVTDFAQFAAQLTPRQRRDVGCFYSPSRQCYTTPSITTFHNILARLPPDTLENAVSDWASQQSELLAREAARAAREAPETSRLSGSEPTGRPAIAIDGKDVRGASQQTADGRRMLVAAVEHEHGLVLGQVEVAAKTNEIPALRELASEIDCAGRVITADAMHAQQETARHLLGEGAHYVITAVKDNQPTILDDLQHMDFSGCPAYQTVDKGHGRLETRTYAVKDITAPEWDDYAQLHGRQQAIRIVRERQVIKTGKISIEETWALISPGPDETTPEQLAAMIRNHWHIENRLHYVRDFTYDEDRCRAYVRDMPRNPACLTNAAISIIRCQTDFPFVPRANQHYAYEHQEALDRLLNPPAS